MHTLSECFNVFFQFLVLQLFYSILELMPHLNMCITLMRNWIRSKRQVNINMLYTPTLFAEQIEFSGF